MLNLVKTLIFNCLQIVNLDKKGLSSVNFQKTTRCVHNKSKRMQSPFLPHSLV
jgi:hypothetical protein